MSESAVRRVVMIRPSFGGVGHVAHACAGALRERQIDVDELLGDQGGSPALDGVRAIWRARRAIRAADIVHVELGRTALAAFWLGAWAAVMRSDLVVVLHDGPVMVNAPGSGIIRTARGRRDIVAHQLGARALDRPLRWWMRRRTQSWVVLSDRAAETLVAARCVPVTVVEHGADAPSGALPPSQCTTAVYAGYFSESKGFDVLVDAWVRAGVQSGLKLVVAGTKSEFHGAWTDALRARLEEADSSVTWLDAPDDETFHAAIAGSAVVVIPYRTSNPVSGIVVRGAVEGRAILGTDVPAVVDVLERGTSAYVVAADDVAALADGLCVLGRDPALRDQLGLGAATWARQHATWSRHAGGLLEAYGRVTTRTGQ